MSRLLGPGIVGRTGSLLQIPLLVLALLLAVFFLGSTIFGAYLNFSPVPMIDSWTGMVDFYLKSRQDPMVWWAQHNEHRIFFSKLLFWLDMRYFSGSGRLLVPANIVLLLLVWGTLSAYANKLIGFSSWRQRVLIAATLGMFCVAWMQSQNIIFSFQSMFILVFLLPLLAFYCLAQALEASPPVLRWRWLSLFFAVASAHCMVNGIFVLPLLALLSWYGERSRRWLAIFLACAAVSLAVFLIGYEKSIASPVGIETLLTKPLSVLAFGLAYLGSPFYLIFGRIELAVAAGAFAIALTMYLWLSRAAHRSSPFALALFSYVLYIFATAGVTAVGRVMFTLPFAASGRYLTPALTMWAALLILLLSRSRHVARWSAVALLAVAALLLPAQMRAFKIDTDMYTPQIKAVSALSLQLGIDDRGARSRLALYLTPKAEDIFRRAREHKVAIFSAEYAYPANQIGRPLREAGGEPCAGQISFQHVIDKNRAAYRIGGSLMPGSPAAVRYVLFGDAGGLVKGIAIPGRDTDGQSGPAGVLNFDGYMFDRPDFVEMRCIL